MSFFRSLWACASLAALVAGAPSPAAAYRVFLDADDDDDPTTFRNAVDGPVETPVTIVVSLDEGDVAVTELAFFIEWDCTPEGAGCWLATPHGDIGFSSLDDSYPFSGIDMMACTGLGCNCMAARYFDATVDEPAVGTWVLATLPFTRLGMGPGCDPLLYPEVEFRVQCSICDYDPGDDPFTRMLLTGDSPATPVPVDEPALSWGQVKTMYR